MRVVLLLALASCATTSPPVRPAPAPAAAASPPPRTPGATPTQVLPGDSVGPVHARSSYDDLVARIGADAVQQSTVDLGEGVTTTATVVYPDTDRELRVIWQTAEMARPQTVHVVGSAWELPEGLHIGQPLGDVVAALGPFQFRGFGWDGGGTVMLGNTPLAKHADALYLRLHAGGPIADSLMGDRAIGTDHPDGAAANVVLHEARVHFP